MRLLKYLSYSPVDEKVNKFRTMIISLTTDTKETHSIFNEICEQYNIQNIEPIIEKLNKELRKFYNGKYMYGLCYETDKKVSDLNCNKRKAEFLTMSLFEANDSLSHIKSELETILKSSLQTP